MSYYIFDWGGGTSGDTLPNNLVLVSTLFSNTYLKRGISSGED